VKDAAQFLTGASLQHADREKSHAEHVLQNIMKAKGGQHEYTDAQDLRYEKMKGYADQVRSDPTTRADVARAAVKDPALKPGDAKSILEMAKLTTLQYAVENRLSAEESVKVYEAGTPEERAQIYGPVMQKLGKTKLPVDQIRKLVATVRGLERK